MRRGVGDGAEGDDELGVDTVDRLQHAGDVGGPGDVRLDAVEGDEIPIRRRSTDRTEDVARPDDAAFTVDVLDRRPGDGEVVEGVGIDLADDDAVGLTGDQPQRRSRHPCGVEPSAEGDEQHGVGQRGSVVDCEVERLSHGVRASAWCSIR